MMAVLSVLQQGLISYNESLFRRPLLTKAITSGITAALGNFLGQVIGRQRPISPHSIARYAAFGLLLIGPLAHNFYRMLDVWVPQGRQGAAVMRLLVDRLGFAPLLIFLHLYILALMEVFSTPPQGKSRSTAEEEVRHKFWPALKMNWKVWTPVQFINVNYIPQQYRSLFANIVALFWVVYLTNKRRQAIKKE